MAWASQASAILGMYGETRAAAWRDYMSQPAAQAEAAYALWGGGASAECPICSTPWSYGHLAGKRHARQLQLRFGNGRGTSVEQIAETAWVAVMRFRPHE